MPDIDLSSQIPAEARWIKIRYEITPRQSGAELLARVWSGSIDDAVILKGAQGEAFVRLDLPGRLSYQRPATVDLKLKVVAFKSA